MNRGDVQQDPRQDRTRYDEGRTRSLGEGRYAPYRALQSNHHSSQHMTAYSSMSAARSSSRSAYQSESSNGMVLPMSRRQARECEHPMNRERYHCESTHCYRRDETYEVGQREKMDEIHVGRRRERVDEIHMGRRFDRSGERHEARDYDRSHVRHDVPHRHRSSSRSAHQSEESHCMVPPMSRRQAREHEHQMNGQRDHGESTHYYRTDARYEVGQKEQMDEMHVGRRRERVDEIHMGRRFDRTGERHEARDYDRSHIRHEVPYRHRSNERHEGIRQNGYHRQREEMPVDRREILLKQPLVQRSDQLSGQRDHSHEPQYENGNEEEFEDRQKRRIPSQSQADRGLLRGQHDITKILQTKPDGTPSKQGKTGTPVQLQTNYFKILKKPTWQLYLYRVDFSPEISNRAFQGGLFSDQLKSCGPYLFDGTMLYLTVKLKTDKFLATGKKDNQSYSITIKLVDLVAQDTYQYLHVWALILRKCQSVLGLTLIGRNYYDPSQRVEMQVQKLQLWPGFETAIHQHERDVLLCVDISTKVMRTETVHEIWKGCANDRQLFTNRVLGFIVRTTYNNKTYKIADVNFEQSPADQFTLKEDKTDKTDKTVSYIQYYAEKYGKEIRDAWQPMLIVRSTERNIRAGQPELVALVPELCCITRLDASMKSNQLLKEKITEVTNLNPREYIYRSKELVRRMQEGKRDTMQINKKEPDVFNQWKFELDRAPVLVQGRVLDNECILFGENKQFQTTNWSKEFHQNKMYVSQHLDNWALIYPNSDRNVTQSFLGTLKGVANGMKYRINDPHEFAVWDHNYEKALDSAVKRDPQLIVCVLSNADPGTYGRIKKFCFEKARPSQVLVRDTMKKGKSVATKVVIQINTKLGGVPWMLDIPLSGLMTIGFDVYHGKGKNKKSYGAMVATMDMKIGEQQKYYSAVSEHGTGVELSNDFSMRVLQALRDYHRERGAMPKNILIYRGGVGEGQIPYVKAIEIENILSGLSPQYEDKKSVPLTFIVVTKKNHTRFFENVRGGCQNPQPGTIVDDVITLPERHDFKLVSQNVGKGTASPTNYNILHNSMGLSSDTLQRLTYKMTHLYYNWSGTLSVPAVCQYASKLAYLVGNYSLSSPTNGLQKTLYFLKIVSIMIPLIDCTPIANESFEDVSFEDYSKVAREIGEAMTGIGMCNLINHGVSIEKIKKVYDLSKKFFELPTETKLKYRKASPKKSFHGYSGPGDEFLNEDKKNSTELREFWDFWGPDSFDEKMYPEDDVPGFKASIDAVRSELENTGKKILRCIEICLQLEEGTLTSEHRNLGDHSIKTQTQMRSLYYYKLNPNDNFPPNAIRCGEHSDWGTITFLIQDMIGGLEVKTSDGEWISAAPVKNAILLNSGQLMEYWTGGHFHAAPHRVRIITEGREARDPRQSFVFFINPDGDSNVFPLVPVLPKKEIQFEKFHNEPVNAYDHYHRLIEAATLY